MEAYEKENLTRLRGGLAECTVLLKRDGKFPLSGPCKLAAYGSGVRHTVKGGTGSGEVNSRYFVTVEQGLKNAGFAVTTFRWLDAYDQILETAKKQFIKDIKDRARKNRTLAVFEGMGAVMPEPEYRLPLDAPGEAAVYVLSRISGEGSDRNMVSGDFYLSETEKRDILALNRQYEKFMLVLNVGGPVDLTPVLGVKNILVLSQLGVETGAVLADILLGKAYPSGKLTTTWARGENYPDVGDFGTINDACYREGIYVGYRWFDAAGKKVMYPFGYGLGYTDFAVSEEEVSLQGDTVTLRARVTNTGKHPGKEVLQVYLSCPQGKLDKPVKDLVAFGKTGELAPGQSELLEISFSLTDCASYDEETAAYILEQGLYTVLWSADGKAVKPVAALELGQTVITRQVKPLLGDPGFADWKPACAAPVYDVPVISVDAGAISAQRVEYEMSEEIDGLLETLSGEELCLLNMGAFDPRGGLSSVIGNAATTVAGAAGETTSRLKEKGIPSLVMADGPAGLRISARCYQDAKGMHSYGPALPASMAELMPWPVSAFLGGTPKLPKGTVLQEQYCTAIPIGTALAQSWNLEYAQRCGDVVGDELDRFSVHLWLAPALNIHRTALCGRNFEYYSEDPYISGRMAAAITRGIQGHPGRGVTLKHYCANNQETNRCFSNSRISQRALREIYLKGFQIAIREGKPLAVMTSYNLLNGIHTSERRDLCVDVLRREFGFDGVCMTDWVVSQVKPVKGSQYTGPDPAVIAAAGGELFMPGSKADHDRMVQGMKAGRVTEEALRINGTRVYRLAKQLTE